ncbi:MAG: LON peptidase substrate-binding domain-containing protein [Acidobacteria bacterium]|nr:LON peptidase substrate-binding domain-containing protein [Acidobacteriota bacterium]
MTTTRFSMIGIWVMALACSLATPATLAAQTTATGDAPVMTGGLPETIPIFPLPSATLFPNASHAFRIYEPRYRTMIVEAMKGNRLIGMTTLRPGFEADYEGRPPIEAIGCAGLITDFEALPNGEFNIVLGGLVKFRVLDEEDDSRIYRLARVEPMEEVLNDQDTAALGEVRQELESLLLAMTDRLGIVQPPAGVPDEQVVDELAQYLPIDPSIRQELLEERGALERGRALVDVLERLQRAR